MVSLTASLRRLATVTGPGQTAATQQVYQDAVMYLLEHDPFYGRVLSQLTVTVGAALTPIGLAPTKTGWQLRLSPGALAASRWTGAQWLAMLRHTVLHLVWQHPTRYATALKAPQQAALVRWATDAAVNDYLTDLPAGALTSRRLQDMMGRSLPRRADSAVYWRELRQWRASARSGHHLTRRGPTSVGASADRWARTVQAAAVSDDHQGWQAANDGDAAQREQWRQQVLRTTAESLSAKQRGTLPGAIQAALTVTPAQHPLDWRGRLQRHLGQVPTGRQPAYGRFNRRQPWRMELPGQTTATWQTIQIFVDESGSMGNREIGYLLGQLTSLLAIYPAPVTVYPFDTVVHLQARQRLTGRVTVRQRVGGGGTRFQAVFDALPRLMRTGGRQLVIILTDGYGERQVQVPVACEVLWLLTSPAAAFSVQRAPGNVISLSDDPQWRGMREEMGG